MLKRQIMAQSPIASTLRICPGNPRYFSGADGKAILLTGSHTWNNLVDMGPKGAVVPFDFAAYLDLLEANGHNFIRLWTWDMLATWNPKDEVLHCPWKRTGPGTAADGKPKLDLTKFDDEYFQRLEERVAAAAQRGIYVNVMLFESWSNFAQNKTPLDHHVFAGCNNINNVDVASQVYQGIIGGWCAMHSAVALGIQEAYVREIVTRLNRYDNVLYEISNEAGIQSHAWQEHLTRYIRSLEASLPKQHPVGQTGGMGTSNHLLHESSADYVAPECWGHGHHADGYRFGHYTFGQGPGEKGGRPVFLDTDHLWGIGGTIDWAWKSFCRGYNMLYMDRWDDQPSGFFEHQWWHSKADPALRRELGAIRGVSTEIDLTTSMPSNPLCSSGYCLAVPGHGYVAYSPTSGSFSLELPAGRWLFAWHNPTTGEDRAGEHRLLQCGGTWECKPPFEGPSVLVVRPFPT